MGSMAKLHLTGVDDATGATGTARARLTAVEADEATNKTEELQTLFKVHRGVSRGT